MFYRTVFYYTNIPPKKQKKILTTSVVAVIALSTIIWSLGIPLGQIFSLKTAKAAAPTFSAVKYKNGSNKLLVVFDQWDIFTADPSSSTTGLWGSQGALTAADFVVGGTAGLTISSIFHDGGGKQAILTLSGNVSLSASGQLTLGCATNAIYNRNSEACAQTGYDVHTTGTADAVAPTISWLNPMGQNGLEIQFSEPIDQTSGTGAANYTLNTSNTTDPYNGTATIAVQGGATSNYSITRQSWDPKTIRLDLWNAMIDSNKTSAYDTIIIGVGVTDIFGNALASASTQDIKWNTGGYMESARFEGAFQKVLAYGKGDGGSTTTLVDDALNGSATAAFDGMVLYITKGTNAGQSKAIANNGFNDGTDTLTVSSAFSSAIDSTSRYEIRDPKRVYVAYSKNMEKVSMEKTSYYTLSTQAADTITITSVTQQSNNAIALLYASGATIVGTDSMSQSYDPGSMNWDTLKVKCEMDTLGPTDLDGRIQMSCWDMPIEVGTPPLVEGVAIDTAQATGVNDIGKKVRIRFDKPLDEANALNTSAYTFAGGATIATSGTSMPMLDMGMRQVVLTIASGTIGSYVNLATPGTGGPVDLLGQAVTNLGDDCSTVSGKVRCNIDATRPTITKISANRGTDNTFNNGDTVVLTFSKAMDKWSANNSWSFEPLYGSQCVAANIIPGDYTTTQNCQWGYWGDGSTMAWNTAGTQATITLGNYSNIGEGYIVKPWFDSWSGSGVSDLSGNTVDYVNSIKTIDTSTASLLKLIWTDTDTSGGTTSGDTIRLNFSKSIDTATVGYASMDTLFAVGGGGTTWGGTNLISSDLSWASSNTGLIVRLRTPPSGTLIANGHTVTPSTNVKDANGSSVSVSAVTFRSSGPTVTSLKTSTNPTQSKIWLRFAEPIINVSNLAYPSQTLTATNHATSAQIATTAFTFTDDSSGGVVISGIDFVSADGKDAILALSGKVATNDTLNVTALKGTVSQINFSGNTTLQTGYSGDFADATAPTISLVSVKRMSSSSGVTGASETINPGDKITIEFSEAIDPGSIFNFSTQRWNLDTALTISGSNKTYGQYPMVNWLNSNQKLEITLDAPATGKTLLVNGDTITATASVSDYVGNGAPNSAFTISSAVPKIISVRFNNQGVATPDTGDTLSVVFNQTMDTSLDSITTDCSANPVATNLGSVIHNALMAENPANYTQRTSDWGSSPTVKWYKNILACDTLQVVLGSNPTVSEGDRIWTDMGYVKTKSGGSITNNGVLDYTGPQLKDAWLVFDANSNGVGNAGDKIFFGFNEPMAASTIASANVDLPLSAGGNYGAEATISWKSQSTLEVTLGTASLVNPVGKTVNPPNSVTDINGNIDNSSATIVQVPTAGLSPVTAVTFTDPDSTGTGIDKMDIRVDFTDDSAASGRYYNVFILPETVPFALSEATGTADSGSTTTLVDADGSLSSTTNIYRGKELHIIGGTGVGQHQTIQDYNGTTKTITVDTAFSVALDNTSRYEIRNYHPVNDMPKVSASGTTSYSYSGAISSYAIFDDSRFAYLPAGTPPPSWMTFYPLMPNTNYRAYVNACTDSACNNYSMPVSSATFQFTGEMNGGGGLGGGGMGTNFFAPQVWGCLPWPGATDIPTNLTFAACKFSQAMDSTTVNSTNVTVKKVSDSSSVPVSVYYSSEQEAAFIKLQTGSTLTASTQYKIEVSTNIKSNGGANIMNSWYSEFTTGTGADSTPPKIMDNKLEVENLCTSGAGTVSSPCAGVEISRVYELGFRFDEDMDPSTLDNTSVTLTNTTDSLDVSGEFNYDPMWRGGSFMLSSVLQASKTYKLTVLGSLVKDDAGNFLDGDKDTVAGGDYNYYFNTVNTNADFATTAPKIKWAFADGFHLGVGFGDPKFDNTAIAVKESTITNASNWTLESPVGTIVSLSGANMHYDPFMNEVHFDGLGLVSGSQFKVTASANIKGFNGVAIDANNNSFTGLVEGFKGSGAIGVGGPCPSCDTSKPTDVNTMMFMPINVWPMNSISGQVSNYMINIPLTQAVNHGGKVLLQFPTGFDISSAAVASGATEAFMNQDINGPGAVVYSSQTYGTGIVTISNISNSTTNNTITLTLSVDYNADGTGDANAMTMTNDFLGFMLKGIVNGDPSQVTYSTTNPDGIGGHQVTINTKNSDGKSLEGPISSMRFPIEKGGAGMVTGTVTKSDGTTAVANVRVLLDSPRGMHLEKTTGADGKFTFTGLPTASDLGVTYWIFVEAKSTAAGDFFGSQSVEVKLTDANPVVRDKTIKLQTGDKTISGTLTYAASLQNKKVVVNASGPNGWLEKEVTLAGATSQAYSISVMSGDWNINVWPYFPKDNFMAGPPPAPPFMPPASQVIKITTANVASVNFALTVPDKTITGSVKDQNGNGLSGVEVWAYDPGGTNGFGTNTQTQPDGTYTLNVLAGTYKVGAAMPGMPPIGEKSITAPATGINFTLSKADNSVKGSVFDESGKPIPGAGVDAYNNTTKQSIFAPTNAQGFYTLFLPIGTWTIKAFAPGYGQVMTSTGVATYSITISANDALTGKDFKAGGGTVTMRTISGYVCSSQKVDSSGNLLAGCKSGYEVSGAMVGAEEVVTATGVRTGNYNEVATGSDGTFSIKVPANVAANSYNIWAYIPGAGELDGVSGINVKDANAGTTEYPGLTLVTPDTKTVNIVFKDSAGAAFMVKEAFVDAWDPTTFKGNKIQINNSSSGTLDLPNGTYEMAAHIPGFGMMSADGGRVSVSRDNQTVNFTIVVTSTFTIQGTVYKPGGSTVVDEAWVQVFDSSAKRGNDDKISPSDNGAFSISVPTGGSYTLIVETPPQSGYMGYKHSSAITEAVNLSGASKIVLSAADSSISGKVYTDSAKTTAATKAFVRAEEVGGTRIVMDEVALEDNGSYTLNVPSGSQWNITTVIPGTGKFAESQSVAAGSTSSNNGAKVNLAATTAVIGFTKPRPSSTPVAAGKGKIINDPDNDIKIVVEPSDLGSNGENFVVEVETMPSVHKTQSTTVFAPEEKEITIYKIDSSGKKTKVGNTQSAIDISLVYDKSDFVDISTANTALNPSSLKEVELAPWDDTTGNTWSSSSTTKKVKVKDAVSDSWRNESIDTFITNITNAGGNYTGANYYDFEIEFTTATTHFSPFGTPTGADLTPVAPTTKPSVTKADGQVTASWTYTFNESDGSYFNLYRNTQDNFASLTQSQLDALQVNTESSISIATYCSGSQPGPFTCSYTNTGLTNGTAYYYVYTAVDSGHKGDTVTNMSPVSSSIIPTSSGGGGSPGGGGGTPAPIVTPTPTPTETVTPASTTFKTGDLVRAIGGSKVYVIKNGKKRWIPTAAAFNASGYKWADIKDTSASDVSGTKDTALFRAEGDPKVYILASNGKRRHIPNPEVFASYGFDWGEVSIITKAEKDAYTDMTLMRVVGDSKVYRLVNGVISHIPDPATFKSYGYSWDDVVEMNATEFAVYKKDDTTSTTSITDTTEIPSGYKFSKRLEYNGKSDDVKYLQIFLKSQGSDIYPEAVVSGWFGPATKKALIRFQEKYASDILIPFDITKGTGVAGSKTNEKINKILGR